MNILKRTLAMMLVLCLLFGMAPMTAFAEETTDTVGTAAPADVDGNTGDNNDPDDDQSELDQTKDDDQPDADQSKDNDLPVIDGPAGNGPVADAPVVDAPVIDEAPKIDDTQDNAPKVDDTQDNAPETNVPAADDTDAVMTAEVPEEEIATASIASITMGTKPNGGTTSGEPFPQGTAGSNSFRIPALVTLSNGNLLAAADARWNTTYDGGGLDTIVSVSTNGGSSWSYSFANYLGDHGNEYNGAKSTCFIDPALAVSGNTVYMLVDLYPYGVALNGDQDLPPVNGTGFNANGKLLLSANNHSSYDYYLDGDTIYSTNGTPVEGYTVDAYFNITEEATGLESNLFFSNSPYKVVRTGFLYLTKSTDGGATWSAPKLLNLKFSDNSERVCLVGPGRGLVTSTGMIVFPVYSFNSNSAEVTTNQQAGFIYSTDGVNWKRSASLPNRSQISWSSESAVVELESGTLRFFFRNGTTNLCYVDYSNGAWESPVVLETIDTNSNCQISAITYSKTIDGKQVILVSCPTGPSEAGSDQSGASYRKNGKIFVFTVSDDGFLSLVAQKNVTSNDAQFMYSCLTELADGTVGILYEDKENSWGTGSNCYYTMSFAKYDLVKDFGLTFDAEPVVPEVPEDVTKTDETTGVEITAPGLEKVEVSAQEAVVTEEKVTKTYAITLNDGAYKDSAIVRIPYDPAFDGCDAFVGYVKNEDGTSDSFKVDVVDGYFVCDVPHFSEVTINGNKRNTVTVRIPVNGTSDTYVDNTGNYASTATIEDATVAQMNVSGTTTAGGTKVTALTTLSTNDKFYIQVSEGVYRTANGGTTNDVSQACLWTAVYASNEYCAITNPSGQYLSAGYGTISVTNYYSNMKMSNGQLIGYWSDLSAGKPVTISETAPAAATTVSFTGLKAGTTTAIVGTTTFNITVYEEVGVKVNYICNGKVVATGTVKVPSDAAADTVITLPASVTDGTNTYKVNSTTLTLTNGVAAAYSVATTLVEGTEITIRENETQEISVTLGEGQYVEWTCADSNYVGVAGKYDATNKKYTNTAVMVGQNITTNPVLVTGTVYNADGSVSGAYKWLVTVVAGSSDNNTSSKKIHVTIDEIENCTVYYSINAGELIKVNGTGVLIDETVIGHYNLMFFAAPHEGYALTFMGLSQTDNQYYSLADGNPDGTGSNAWPFNSDTQTTIPSDKGDSAWKSGHGFRWSLLEGNYGIEQMKIMFSQAIALGCDGATNITKNSGEGCTTVATFRADKLATIDKSVEGILPKDQLLAGYKTYEEGIEVHEGDFVYFKITVTQERPNAWQNGSTTKAALVYNDVTLSDVALPGAYFYDAALDRLDEGLDAPDPNNAYKGLDGLITKTENQHQELDITSALNADWGANETQRVLSYYVVYEIKSTDGKLYNTADLDYTYRSSYSHDSKDLEADAQAEITVTGAEIPDYVVDFGLPLVIDGLTERQLPEVKLGETNTEYGKLLIEQNSAETYEQNSDKTYKITYTPTKIMEGVETIKLYGSYTETVNGRATENERLINDFNIYPATTVYYGEQFIDFGSGWSTEGTYVNVGNQETEVLGSSTYYGFDDAYATDKSAGASNGTAAKATGIGSKGTFTFTGTGIQVFANSTSNTGYVSVMVKNKNTGAYANVSMVDTVLNSVDNHGVDVSEGVKGLMGLPVVSLVDLTGLTHATYEVTVTKIMDEDPVYIDGIRVFGTVNEAKYDNPTTADSTNPNPFWADKEDNPSFYEVRDMVLKAVNIEDVGSADYKTLYEQLYAGAISENASAVITSVVSPYGEANRQELLDKGPKNELYLYPNETLTFNVQTPRVVQLGLKAPEGTASYKLNGATDSTTINTTVDMFYKIAGKGAATNGKEIKLENTGSTILSVTLLKVCDDPNVSFPALTEANIRSILADAGYTEEPEAPTYTMVELKGTDVLIDGTVFDYTGEAIEPAITVNVGGTQLVEGKDYSVTYTNNVEPGTATVTVRGIATASETLGYTGEVSIDFTINAPSEPEVPEIPTEPAKPGRPGDNNKPGQSNKPGDNRPGNNRPGDNNRPGQSNKPGKPSDDKQNAEKKATLKITFVNLAGKKVGTATLTKTGAANRQCVFTASEINAQAPARRIALWLTPAIVTYGQTVSLVVPVF